MYEYEERKDKSSIKGVIVQILLMVMFIFILICLFPSKSDLDKLKNVESISSLEPLYDRIFNNNIIAMKDAAKSYYTTPRLPKNVGDTVSMTLGEMLDKKIILPFTDKNGDQCDLEESYVSVTKKDDEFQMKVNLKCNNQENYLIVVMGCYDYCETGICEKNETDIKSPTINSTKPSTIVNEIVVRPIINNNITINNYCVSENCKPGKYYCTQIGNNFYGQNGNLVDKETYEKECGKTEEKYYCKQVGDKYYGVSGNVVDKTTYEKECGKTEEKYYCKQVGDKYYGINGNVVDKTTYEKECGKTEEKYYCKQVGDKYYGKNGNVVDKATYEKECIQYQCKYMKTTNSTFSAWSDWSDWTETRQVASNLKQERSQVVTLHKLEKQLIGYKTVTYKDPKKPIYQNKQILIGTRNETKCIEYGYVTSTGAIDTNVVYGDWVEDPNSPVKLYTPPQHTSTERYEKISVGSEPCENCGARMYKIYKKFIRTVSRKPNSTTSSVYQCLRTATQEVPVYGTQSVIVDYDTSTKREAVYGLVTVEKKVNRYSYRTRSIIGGKTDYQISNCNDTNLLNNGYQIIEKIEI